MAEHVFRLPDVGEGIAEAEVVTWLVAVGDEVATDQPIVEVMTDKATIEIASPVAGSVVRLGGAAGDVIAVGADLIAFATSSADEGPAAPSPERPEAQPPPEVVPDDGPPRPGTRDGSPSHRRPLAAPSVRRRARELGIDLSTVAGSGPAGRIEHEDLSRPAEAGDRGRRAHPDTVVEVPLVGLRRRIAERMVLTASRIPHITYVEEVDVTDLERLRATLNREHPGLDDLTPLPFVALATIRAISDHAAMNGLFDDEAGILHQHRGVHLGVATQTPRGLVVPVVRHAEALDLWGCAAEIRRLSVAARGGRATSAELSGSTITISSLGALGGIVTTPLINHPEVAIVGVNKIRTQPMWADGGFLPRQVMHLSSSFDHRVVDGWDAARFVQRIRSLLEQPATLFIEGAP